MNKIWANRLISGTQVWEDVPEKSSLLGQFSGAFWGKLLRTFLVLAVLFGIGIKLIKIGNAKCKICICKKLNGFCFCTVRVKNLNFFF